MKRIERYPISTKGLFWALANGYDNFGFKPNGTPEQNRQITNQRKQFRGFEYIRIKKCQIKLASGKTHNALQGKVTITGILAKGKGRPVIVTLSIPDGAGFITLLS